MKKHLAWMAACCLVPLALAVGISFLSVGRSLNWLVSLICPVLMIASMWGMHASEKDEQKREAGNR